MEIHLIRHATIKIKYGNKMFLVDPWLMKKDEMPGFPKSSSDDSSFRTNAEIALI